MVAVVVTVAAAAVAVAVKRDGGDGGDGEAMRSETCSRPGRQTLDDDGGDLSPTDATLMFGPGKCCFTAGGPQ